MKIVSLSHFTKRYGDHLVINDISLEVLSGEIFGILGINGAGKTTLLESIEGIRKYDAGEIKICGLPHQEALKKAKFGVQLQSSTLPETILVKEAIKLFCLWNNENRINVLSKMFDLSQLLDKTYKSLSTGQKRKLHLALALVNDPEVVFLDEPTAGLDVEARAELHQTLKELKKSGKTIILSSHDMAEVESLCDRIAFLKNGQIYFQGTIKDFRKLKQKGYVVRLKVVGDIGVETYEITSINDELPQIIQNKISLNQEIEDLEIEKPSLEDSFLEVARGE